MENLSGGDIATEAGIVIRMNDKVSRAFALTHHGVSEGDEKLEDTLHDLLGYSALLLCRYLSRDPAKWQSHLARICPPPAIPETPDADAALKEAYEKSRKLYTEPASVPCRGIDPNLQKAADEYVRLSKPRLSHSDAGPGGPVPPVPADPAR